ncbi:hypothetical protein V2J09_014603 [Rumex salicifolius]
MGNCSQKSSATIKPSTRIRILTETGRIMEFEGPKLAHEVLDDFPGYGIFRRGQAALPLFDDEQLHGGQLYFLLPFGLSASTSVTSAPAPPLVAGGGVWRVKLAISAEELKGILSEGANAEALIGRMRVAAVGAKDGRIWKPAVRSYWVFGHRRSAITGSVQMG